MDLYIFIQHFIIVCIYLSAWITQLFSINPAFFTKFLVVDCNFNCGDCFCVFEYSLPISFK
uniref:Candidate secreted effector n=1 Tax=Meloidogyne incognita TaxID=6306 RepID=A0A914LBN4_MELIC